MTSHGSLQKAPVAQSPLKYKHLVPTSIRKCIPKKPRCPFYIGAQIDNLPEASHVYFFLQLHSIYTDSHSPEDMIADVQMYHVMIMSSINVVFLKNFPVTKTEFYLEINFTPLRCTKLYFPNQRDAWNKFYRNSSLLYVSNLQEPMCSIIL